MKGIYKKISVGVLAAVLLVGGSGALKGGQAFAGSNAKQIWNVEEIEIELENQSKYRRGSRDIDADKGYDWMECYNRLRSRSRVVSLLEDGLIRKAVEIRGPKDYEMQVDHRYNDGDDLENRIDQLGKGEHKVKVGSLYFRISK